MPAGFWRIRAVFFCSTLASMAPTVQLNPTLVERGDSAQLAAGLLAMLEIIQLPGRIFVLSGRRLPGAGRLLPLQLLLQAAGLMLLAFTAPLGVAFDGMSAFGISAGLNTLVRPLVIQIFYGWRNAVHLNVDLARAQHARVRSAPAFASSHRRWRHLS